MTTSHDERAARADLERIHSLRDQSQSIRRVTGLRSKAVMGGLVAEEVFRGRLDQPAAGTAVRVRVRELDGRAVWLRPRSHDRTALDFLAYGYHLPPAELTGPVRQIAAFGANIGLLLAGLAGRYPHARLLGVEPDRDNAALARLNLAHLGIRCTLKETAVWHRDETLTLSWQPDAWGQALTEPPHRDGNGAPAIQLDAVDAGKLLGGFSGQAPVNYLLVNIESAWYEMLRHGEWAQDVRCMLIAGAGGCVIGAMR